MKSLNDALSDFAKVHAEKIKPQTVADGLAAMGVEVTPQIAQTRYLPYDSQAVVTAAIHTLQLEIAELKRRLATASIG